MIPIIEPVNGGRTTSSEPCPKCGQFVVAKWEFCPNCGAPTKGQEQATLAIAYECGADVFAPQPPIPWVVPDLYIASGRPVLVAGYGYSAKTVSLQAMLLSVASGTIIWGRFRVQRPGIVLHLDHEQGKRATKIRYQRLARAQGIDPAQMWDNLRIACLPPNFRMSNATAEEQLIEACQGVVLCLIDSLRASVEGVDENDSSIRQHLDKLTRVSEVTGTTFILIHHAGKGGGKDRDARESARGSSAIFDACGTVLRLVGEAKDDGSTEVHVTMTKTSADACGARANPFYLVVDDVSDGADATWGLRCEHRTEEQINPPLSPEQAAAALDASVLAFIRRAPSCSFNEIQEAAAVGRGRTRASLDRLERRGSIRITKAGTKHSHSVNDVQESVE